MTETITAHSLAHRLLALDDLPIMIHVIKDPSTFRLTTETTQGWDAESEYCNLDPDDVEVKPTAIVFIVELTDWDEEMDQLND